MATKQGKLAAVLLIVVVVVLLAQSGVINWRQPVPVNLSFTLIPDGGGDTGGSYSTVQTSAVHVADTWQSWILTRNDGTHETRSSDIVGIGTQIALVDLNVFRFIEVDVPIKLVASLPQGTTNGLPYYTWVSVQPTMAVQINGQTIATASQNWFQLSTFSSTDQVGKLVTYKFWIWLSGPQIPFPNVNMVDLRSQVASISNQGSGTFKLAVTISEVWDAYRYWNYVAYHTDHQGIPVAFSIDFGVNLASATSNTVFTVSAPTQAVSTNTGGIIIVVTQTQYTTTGAWITATVSAPGTTMTLNTTVKTLENPLNASLCDILFKDPTWNAMCKSWQLPNLPLWEWAVIALVAIVILYLIFRPRGPNITISSRD